MLSFQLFLLKKNRHPGLPLTPPALIKRTLPWNLFTVFVYHPVSASVENLSFRVGCLSTVPGAFVRLKPVLTEACPSFSAFSRRLSTGVPIVPKVSPRSSVYIWRFLKKSVHYRPQGFERSEKSSTIVPPVLESVPTGRKHEPRQGFGRFWKPVDNRRLKKREEILFRRLSLSLKKIKACHENYSYRQHLKLRNEEHYQFQNRLSGLVEKHPLLHWVYCCAIYGPLCFRHNEGEALNVIAAAP